MKRLVLLLTALLLSVSLFGCMRSENGAVQNNDAKQIEDIEQKEIAQPKENAQKEEATQRADSIVYKNTEYSFNFSLPGSWEGFTIVTDKWEGLAIENKQGQKVVETGTLISIRHPKWTSENPRQDIPIMVFTIDQWQQLQQGKFHIGAAPIGPSELGRNNKYVYALPARYNFAFLTGFEEVEDILKDKPLQPAESK